MEGTDTKIRFICKDASGTKRATNVALNVFNSYLIEKKFSQPQRKKELAAVLQAFYIEVRKGDGTCYSKGSLNSLRFGLSRHFKDTLGFDVINDPEFKDANKVFGATCFDLKQQGLAKVEHTSLISAEDLQKLYECGVFGLDNPVTLQNKVFFELMLKFSGQFESQNLHQIKKSDFYIAVNDNGTRYVCKIANEHTNNGRGNHAGIPGGTMVETNGLHCPVASFALYISHLNPMNDFLFQRPRKDVSISENVWYDFATVGEHTLQEKMKFISRKAQLSQTYKNNSIRVTAARMLKESASQTCSNAEALSDHNNANPDLASNVGSQSGTAGYTQAVSKITNTPSISYEDLQKLYQSGVFSLSNPVTLQNKVFFELMLEFSCHIDSQSLSQLKKSDFYIGVNDSGTRSVCKMAGVQVVMMVGTGGPHCPIASFALYINHLNPMSDFLFQRPRKNVSISAEVWYDCAVVSDRPLHEKMKTISREAHLSRTYGYHSIRATALTLPKESVSRARRDAVVLSYGRPAENVQQEMPENSLSASSGIFPDISVS